MFYEELQLKLLKLLRNNGHKVISLDLETKLMDPNEFLTNEPILSISFARRRSGKPMTGDAIEVKTLFLESEEDGSEKKLLEEFDRELETIKPLGVVGYGIRNYDITLLSIKKTRYKLQQPPWKLIDMLESAVHIDIYHVLKYKRYKN